MSGLVVGGRLIPVPGRRAVNWHDDKRIRLLMPEDGRRRPEGTWIRQIILHTTRGIPGGTDRRPQVIRPGLGPASWSRLNIARMWADDDRNSGAHLVVDFDGAIYCLADIADEITYHATTSNLISVGIEIKQGGDAELYEGQIDAVADLVDVLTLELGIQRQIPSAYRGAPIPRMAERIGRGLTCVGVFGHRDQTTRRGAGDPGDAVMTALAGRGYESLDFAHDEDRAVWGQRQVLLGLKADGVPGPANVAELKRRGFAGGLWRCPPPGPPGLAEIG